MLHTYSYAQTATQKNQIQAKTNVTALSQLASIRSIIEIQEKEAAVQWAINNGFPVVVL